MQNVPVSEMPGISRWQRRRLALFDEYERIALTLFATRGFRSVTIEEIAEEAGVSARERSIWIASLCGARQQPKRRTCSRAPVANARRVCSTPCRHTARCRWASMLHTTPVRDSMRVSSPAPTWQLSNSGGRSPLTPDQVSQAAETFSRC